LVLSLKNTIVPSGIIFSSHLNSLYVPYNSEDAINDIGWGCAWRAIQMYLSSPGSNIYSTYSNLFNKFGSREILDKLF
jgi:hypothetical protein